MIVKSHRQSSLYLLCTMKGSIVPTIAYKILAAAVWGVLAKIVKNGYLGSGFERSTAYAFVPFTTLGVAVSLFLGFHNNASYARWWEARTIWGKHVIDIRNLIRFLLTSGLPSIMPSNTKDTTRTQAQDTNSTFNDKQDENETADPDIEQPPAKLRYESADWKERVLLLAMAHAHATRDQLRDTGCQRDLVLAREDRNRYLTPLQRQRADQSVNAASTILCLASEVVGQQSTLVLDSYTRIHIMQLLDALCSNQTACERIQNTSLPLAYSLLVHRTSFLFVILVPWAMVTTMSWWTPVFTAILAYTFFGLDELARQCQEPFLDEPNALALSAICRTMERDVCEALGYSVPPALLVDERTHILM